jgi:hypothetical protein
VNGSVLEATIVIRNGKGCTELEQRQGDRG